MHSEAGRWSDQCLCSALERRQGRKARGGQKGKPKAGVLLPMTPPSCIRAKLEPAAPLELRVSTPLARSRLPLRPAKVGGPSGGAPGRPVSRGSPAVRSAEHPPGEIPKVRALKPSALKPSALKLRTTKPRITKARTTRASTTRASHQGESPQDSPHRSGIGPPAGVGRDRSLEEKFAPEMGGSSFRRQISSKCGRSRSR